MPIAFFKARRIPYLRALILCTYFNPGEMGEGGIFASSGERA